MAKIMYVRPRAEMPDGMDGVWMTSATTADMRAMAKAPEIYYFVLPDNKLSHIDIPTGHFIMLRDGGVAEMTQLDGPRLVPEKELDKPTKLKVRNLTARYQKWLLDMDGFQPPVFVEVERLDEGGDPHLVATYGIPLDDEEIAEGGFMPVDLAQRIIDPKGFGFLLMSRQGNLFMAVQGAVEPFEYARVGVVAPEDRRRFLNQYGG